MHSSSWVFADTFPRGESRHFAYRFQVADDATQMHIHKCFTLSKPQRKCQLLRQHLHTVIALKENFTVSKCLFFVSMNILRLSKQSFK